jgi:DNA-binding transcriptional regulator GbsR (MarR family)
VYINLSEEVEKMSDADLLNIEKRIYETFSDLAKLMGFSPIHGNIIGSLIVGGGCLSLQDIAKKTGYSVSMISLSVDLLEVLGIVRKVKKSKDRKLYIELQGDLLESLKKIFLMRVKKGIEHSLEEFGKSKDMLKNIEDHRKKEVLNALELLEREIKRLEKYIDVLSKVRLR